MTRLDPRSGDPASGTPRVRGLYVYPLKSAAGIAVESVEVDEAGLAFDRRWMVVDGRGGFLSQRTHPRMALLATELSDTALTVRFPDRGSLELPAAGAPDAGADVASLRVWHSDRCGTDCGDEAAAWMSGVLGTPCRVLRARVPADGRRLSPEGRVRDGFADAHPALVVSTASLADLNARLVRQGSPPLAMNRFRPNIVVEGLRPYEEDGWASVRMGSVSVRGVRPCPRCAITTVEQATGDVAGPEPLRTLATYRRTEDGGAAFGVNVAFGSAGVIRVGDEVSARASSPPP